MARRSSSLNQIDSGLSREINSNFDNVKKVADNINAVVTVAGTDLAALTSALTEATDFSGITVVSGPVSGWDPVTKVLTVETVQGVQGEQGIQGIQGPVGIQGAQGVKGVKGDTGPQGTQGPSGKDGNTGPQGQQGPSGNDGLDLTVDQIVYNNDGTFTWDFSDGTTYTTPDLTGPKGDTGNPGAKGDQGVSVHHLKGTNTTDPEGDFGAFGEFDTYTFYGDAAETINLGHFIVRNGLSPEQMIQEGYMLRGTYDLNGDGVVDNAEALGGKSLAQVEQERDQAILAAQLVLGTNYTVADNPARLALTDLTAGDNVFVADDGDGKWAQYWVTAVVDGLGFTSTFEVVMDEDTYHNANTKEGVKATYESNPDTNAFTDAEKSSVDIATSLTTAATTLPTAVNELHTDIGDLSLNTTSTDLTSAVNEVHSELDAHVNEVTGAHQASAIGFDNVTSGLAATEVQAALEELQNNIELFTQDTEW